MFNRIADWIIARAKRTPYWHLPRYMNRWWLVPYKPYDQGQSHGFSNGEYFAKWYRQPIAWLLQRFDIAVRVHEILTSDDRSHGFHDHPWAYITIILKGGYVEVTPEFKSGMYVGDKRTWHPPGSVLLRRAHNWHSLELFGEQPCTTLFVTFKYRQKWGFLVRPEYKRPYHEVFAEAAAKLPEIR